MTLSALIRKRDTGKVATAIPAISATQPKREAATVARIATVAVANPKEEKTAPPAAAANDGPTFVTPDPDYHRLRWWRVAILADGRRIESDTPSGMTIREWTDYAARHFGPGATVTPLVALHAGPYHVRHADGHTWTMHPTGGLPMSRQAIEAEAQRVTAGVHGEVVAVEEVEQ
jgi:hypothetical protein